MGAAGTEERARRHPRIWRPRVAGTALNPTDPLILRVCAGGPTYGAVTADRSASLSIRRVGSSRATRAVSVGGRDYLLAILVRNARRGEAMHSTARGPAGGMTGPPEGRICQYQWCIGTSLGGDDAPPHWPRRCRDSSRRLSRSISVKSVGVAIVARFWAGSEVQWLS